MVMPVQGREYKSRIEFALRNTNELIRDTAGKRDSGSDGSAGIFALAYPLILAANYVCSFGDLQRSGKVYRQR